MQIGPYHLNYPVALAPMAGISDKPFRALCRTFSASWTVGEMISGAPAVRQRQKTQLRLDFDGDPEPVVVQIAGTDPKMMADAARQYVAQGAHVIDINMGCPVKKVCRVAAGSALMRDEGLVREILTAVTAAVNVPVTLKTRLGWDDEHLNVLSIANIAADCHIAALAIHGRSRSQLYRGQARYELIAKVKQEIDLPLWVNGDIDSPQKAMAVLATTQADGVMVGRAAQGAPWLLQEIRHFWQTGKRQTTPFAHKQAAILHHLQAIYQHYGQARGMRVARGHIHAYLRHFAADDSWHHTINAIEDANLQYEACAEFLHQYASRL